MMFHLLIIKLMNQDSMEPIYETSNKKIHVSSYGELLLKYMDDVKKET